MSLSELVLEDLRVNVATRLAVAQSLSQPDVKNIKEGSDEFIETFEDSWNDVLTEDVIDSDQTSNTEQISYPESPNPKLSLESKALDRFLQRDIPSCGHRLGRESDPLLRSDRVMEHSEERRRKKTDQSIDDDYLDFPLGTLSAHLATMELTYPSKATTEVDYM